MKFRKPEEEETLINLTPLIDVVFLLLIFFMISTTFSKESALHIELPASSDKKEQQQQNNRLVIEISADGIYAIQGPGDIEPKQLINSARETLINAIKDVSANRTDLITIIRADRRTPHESVIRAMDSARRVGHVNITFATQQTLEDN